ncbi:MAG: class I SAM-dependent methyltransferase, partial [archaeon]
ANIVYHEAPQNGRVLDLMCGPGYLIGRLSKARSDLSFLGVDIDRNYIAYANSKGYQNSKFVEADVLTSNAIHKYDTVLCTGALHHIPYERQEEVVKHMAKIIKPEGLAIVSDCHIDKYSNEKGRKLAAAKLGYEYLAATIANGAPDDVIKATADIIANDVLMAEFKTSIRDRLDLVEKYFKDVRVTKTWPNNRVDYGDYIITLRGVK